jgi:hypothetical protein
VNDKLAPFYAWLDELNAEAVRRGYDPQLRPTTPAKVIAARAGLATPTEKAARAPTTSAGPATARGR